MSSDSVDRGRSTADGRLRPVLVERRVRRAVFLLASVSLAQACADAVPLYDNLGDHHHAITTTVPEAQAYFDQGLRLVYAFNHAEAIRAFGLAESLRAQGRTSEAIEAEERFQRAWAGADVRLSASRF